jgi:hypothetical protein
MSVTKEYFAFWKTKAIENISVLFNVARIAVRAEIDNLGPLVMPAIQFLYSVS